MNARITFTIQARHIVPRVAKAVSKFSRIYSGLLASLGIAALLAVSVPAMAASAPAMGGAQSFAVLGASAVTNTGSSVITGDLGISPNTASSVTGFPPGIVNGATHYADATALAAQTAVTAASSNITGQACNSTISADLGGMTLAPGVYCSGSSMGLTGTLTLDAGGDPNAVFIFKIGSTLTTASGSTISVINSGQSCNVFWQVGSSATIGTGTTFAGNLIASSSITMTTGASANGRLLAQTGAVTMAGNAVSVCSLAVPPSGPTPPTLSKAFSPSSINAGAVSTLTVTLSNANASVATLTSPLIDTLPSGVLVAATPNASTTCTSGVVAASAGGSTLTLSSGSIPANGSCTMAVDVIAATAGSYINTLIAGALVTSNGNNAAPAVATLVAIPLVPGGPPTLSKAFSPATINTGGLSVLTVTLSNPNAAVATLTSPLIDTLPSGVLIGPTPNASTTCTSGVVAASAGSSTVTLSSGSIPANGSCTMRVNVTAAVAGSYINTLLAGALVTSNGNNPAPAVATLVATVAVIPPVPPGTPAASIPTLSEWAMILLAGLLAVVGFAAMRRQER